MILGDELRAAVPEQVGRAVADIEDADLAIADRGHDHRAAHPRPLGVVACGFEDRRVGLLARAFEPVEIGTLAAVLREDGGQGVDRDAAGFLPRGMTAHPIADHEQRVESGLVAPHHHRVLVLLALETRVGRRSDLKAHCRRSYPPRTEELSAFCPIVIRSPWLSSFSWIGSPLTSVPLVLPRSTIQNASPRRSTRAWCPLVAGSRRMRSLSGERPSRSAASPARWVWPASGPDSMVSSPCGPTPPTARSGRVGPPRTGVSGDAAGAAGGGCHAGISAVASCAASAAAAAPGVTIVAATAGTGSGGEGGGSQAGGGGGGAWPGGEMTVSGMGAETTGGSGNVGRCGDSAGGDHDGAAAGGGGGGAADGADQDGAAGAAGASVLGEPHDGAAGCQEGAAAGGELGAAPAGASQDAAVAGAPQSDEAASGVL